MSTPGRNRSKSKLPPVAQKAPPEQLTSSSPIASGSNGNVSGAMPSSSITTQPLSDVYDGKKIRKSPSLNVVPTTNASNSSKTARAELRGDQLPPELQNYDSVIHFNSLLALNRNGFPVSRVVLLTSTHLFCVTTTSNRCERKILIDDITKIIVSPFWDNVVCLQCAEECDLVLLSSRKTELIALIKKLRSTNLTPLELTLQEKFTFRLNPNDERTLFFSCPEGINTLKAALFVDLRPFTNPFATGKPPAETTAAKAAAADDDTGEDDEPLVERKNDLDDRPRQTSFMTRLRNMFGPRRQSAIIPTLHQLAMEQQHFVYYRWLAELGEHSPYPHNLGLTYTVKQYQSSGSRTYMEDVIVFERNLKHGLGDMMVGIFDGHGGKAVSVWLGQNMRAIIEQQYVSKKVNRDMQKCLMESFAEAQRQIIASKLGECGSTALVVIMRQGKLHIANAGDCRAIILGPTTSKALTIDHKVTTETELRRIKEAGGVVKNGRIDVNGMQINLARALGDKVFQPFVSPVPDYFEHTISPKETHLMLGCDGIFDVLSDEAVAKTIRRTAEPSRLCAQAYALGSHDNLSAILVNLCQQSLPDTAEATKDDAPVQPTATLDKPESGATDGEGTSRPATPPPEYIAPELPAPDIEVVVDDHSNEDIFGIPDLASDSMVAVVLTPTDD